MIPTTGPNPGSTATVIAEREWDKLTNLIAAGCVVPVIGPELLVVKDSDGKPTSLYDMWGRMLAEQSGTKLPGDTSTPLLYYVTNERSQHQPPNDLAYDIDEVVRRQPAPMPESLRKLAAISSFPLYVTTTIDHQLKRALDEVRPGPSGAARQILFLPRGPKDQVDLPGEIRATDSPSVFHLFGATSPVGESFAKTEDDLIQFSWSLLDLNYAPERLFEYLRKKTVLLIGCRFPDWLGRFLIYALHAGRQDAMNVYYVGSHVEQGLEDFLRRRKARIMRVDRAVDFVDELHRRWLARCPQEICKSEPSASPVGAAIKRGAVFLSYAHEDRVVAARIKGQLESAHIDTWMDESGLDPGAAFARVIRENVGDAAYFLAVISRSLDDPNKPGRFLWKEWRWAEDVSLERRRDDAYLQPVCIDDTPAGSRFVEPPFRDLHWTRLSDGRLPDDFIRFLTQGIRRYRSGR